jgi:beta-N-acetylhexosaminidase
MVQEVIRDSIGFKGALMTDDISMGALSGSIGERTAAALAAGCDLVLHCNGRIGEMRAVAAAVPPLGGLAAARAAAALGARTAPREVAPRAQARLAALLAAVQGRDKVLS